MTTVKDLMQRASNMIDEDPDQARKFGGIYKFVLEGDGGRTFIIDLTDNPRVIDGDGAAQCTITTAARRFHRFDRGAYGPTLTVLQGKAEHQR